MLPRDLKTSLFAVQIVAFGTLLRSVAFDRWFTVVASSLMILGALAALRNRTWGVMLTFATAATFAIAWFVGIAPLWFLGVGVVGAVPFLLTRDALSRFDRQAAKLLAVGAVGAGGLAAISFKAVALDLFTTFPALWPSRYPQHGLALLALLAVGVFAGLAQRKRDRQEQMRLGEASDRVRIGETTRDAAFAAELEAEADDEAAVALRTRRSRRQL